MIREKFAALGALLNERTRRRWAAVEARALGRGGIARVAEATGLSRTTIGAGLRELAEGREDEDASGRLRNPGAGRKSLPVHDAGLSCAEMTSHTKQLILARRLTGAGSGACRVRRGVRT